VTVRERQREVDTRREQEPAAPRVWDRPDAVCRRHRGDASDLGEPAGAGDVGLEDVGRVLRQEAAVVESGELAFARRDRDLRRRPDLRERRVVVGRHWFFEPGDVVGLEPAGDPDGRGDVERAVGVDHHVDVVPEVLPRGFDPPDRVLDREVVLAHHAHLDRVEAVFLDVAGQFGPGLLAGRPAAAAVRTDALAGGPEQLVHRLIQVFSEQIPEGDVDPGDRLQCHPASVVPGLGVAPFQGRLRPGAVVEFRPQSLYVRRILADQRRSEAVLDERDHDRRRAECGTQPGEAGVGVDVDERRVVFHPGSQIAAKLVSFGDR